MFLGTGRYAHSEESLLGNVLTDLSGEAVLIAITDLFEYRIACVNREQQLVTTVRDRRIDLLATNLSV